MKKLLIFIALLLIFIAITGSYYNQYKINATKIQTIQETQEMLRRTEALMLDNEKRTPRQTYVVVPADKVDAYIRYRQSVGEEASAKR